MDSFHKMAVRLAEGETKKKKDGEDEGPEQFKPRWQKVKGILQSKVKPTLKDLEQAVKEEDQKLTEYLFERMLELMTGLAKGFGMREFTTKLKTLEKKTFD